MEATATQIDAEFQEVLKIALPQADKTTNAVQNFNNDPVLQARAIETNAKDIQIHLDNMTANYAALKTELKTLPQRNEIILSECHEPSISRKELLQHDIILLQSELQRGKDLILASMQRLEVTASLTEQISKDTLPPTC